ncbi:MAG: Hsp20/alpha crystallin family protein [Deltaproteobacteria bacterium]|nr:Hsp20/alpha crystallin family protein [Deltaproteobacteria bacterium]
MFLTKWDPFETLSNLESDVDTGFGRMLRPGRFRKFLFKEPDFGSLDWLPSVDIKENKESYEFDVEVPGIEKEAIKVFISDNNILNIKGERKKETEKKDENYQRIEREYGSFARSFTLPDNVDTAKVNADYKNGILKVTVAKKELVKPKEIPVKAA